MSEARFTLCGGIWSAVLLSRQEPSGLVAVRVRVAIHYGRLLDQIEAFNRDHEWADSWRVTRHDLRGNMIEAFTITRDGDITNQVAIDQGATDQEGAVQ